MSTTPANLATKIAYAQNSQAVTDPTNAGTYDVTVTSTDTNYTVAPATGTLTIKPATSTTTVVCSGDQVYTGSAITPCTASYTTSDNSTPTSLTVDYTANVNVGTVTASAAYAGDGNHAGSTDSKTFAITPATATITAKNQTKEFGTVFTFTGNEFTSSGLLNGDSVTGATIASDGAVSSAAPTTYPITISGATGTGLGNYTIGYVAGTMTVKDSTATDAPSVNSVTPVSPAKNDNPQVIGSAEPGSTIKIYGDAACATSVMATGTAADFSTTGIIVTIGNDTTHTFYATATDAAGNASTCSSTFVTYVSDFTAPVIAAHGDVNVEATSVSGATVNYTAPTATDAVDGTDTVSCAPASGSTFVMGDTTVTCNATDKAGNAATPTTFKVTVKDTTLPVITLLGANPLVLTVGDSYADPGATASDNIDGNITSKIVVGGDTVTTVAPATFHVTYNVSDNAGNPAVQQTRTVTINDKPAPVISQEKSAGATDMMVTITWTTDHPATSRVVYGLASVPTIGSAPNYGYTNTTVEDPTLTTSHSVTVNALISGTIYYFRAVSHGSPETVSNEITQATPTPSSRTRPGPPRCSLRSIESPRSGDPTIGPEHQLT